ncbi:MAG: hypothetical protein BECKG1743F_GA0114225_104327 [Candidatus Kentron sp. G]|nr:MAG: hypothetical protein BECKG1743F_GA0114225_104327 [Candidatus Kentron sp. G]VFN01793.1 MAG: hypothetical protein BECKG1743E_GA0114224_104437 [Candidatus Kentron sp. G]
MISSVPPLRRLTLLIHTIRYLRPVQVFGRVWYRLYRPRMDLRLPPPVRRIEQPFVPPAVRAPSLVGPRRFRFLNREGTLVQLRLNSDTPYCYVLRNSRDIVP